MDLLGHAVSNNVGWCALVADRGGVPDRGAGVWRVTGRAAPLFPDAVTLRPGVVADAVAAVLVDRPVCSVKDSFADVDLEPHGFRVLFTGRWIGRAPAPVSQVPGWSQVTEPVELARWCTAAELPEVLPLRLLREPSVRILAAHHDGLLVAGAILTLTGAVVGLSNVVQVLGAAPLVWDRLGSVVAAHGPGRPIVGYEHGADLERALAAGFADLGPVRVWLPSGPRPGRLERAQRRSGAGRVQWRPEIRSATRASGTVRLLAPGRDSCRSAAR